MALSARSLPCALGYIVVFKNTASQEAIDRQADGVNQNGGSVKTRYNSIIMKVRTAWHYSLAFVGTSWPTFSDV
jgi:hypothetical protein